MIFMRLSLAVRSQGFPHSNQVIRICVTGYTVQGNRLAGGTIYFRMTYVVFSLKSAILDTGTMPNRH